MRKGSMMVRTVVLRVFVLDAMSLPTFARLASPVSTGKYRRSADRSLF
jgi:hypothetical protein